MITDTGFNWSETGMSDLLKDFVIPLPLQIVNTYYNRMIGYFMQNNGCNVVPNVRWGDRRSYTSDYIPNEIPFAFLGVEKHSIVSIGTYGCCKSRDDKNHFRNGLEAMLQILEPEVVLVYGSMPSEIFGDVLNQTEFHHFPDWTSFRHGRRSYGQR